MNGIIREKIVFAHPSYATKIDVGVQCEDNS